SPTWIRAGLTASPTSLPIFTTTLSMFGWPATLVTISAACWPNKPNDAARHLISSAIPGSQSSFNGSSSRPRHDLNSHGPELMLGTVHKVSTPRTLAGSTYRAGRRGGGSSVVARHPIGRRNDFVARIQSGVASHV